MFNSLVVEGPDETCSEHAAIDWMVWCEEIVLVARA